MTVPLIVGILLTMLCMVAIVASLWIQQAFDEIDQRRRTQETAEYMERRVR